MLEKRNSLRSMSLKCAGVLAIALSVTAGPAAAQDPVGTAFADHEEQFEEGKPGSATYVVVFRLFDEMVPGSSIGARVADVVVVDDKGRFGLPPDFELELLLGGDNEMIYACMNPAGHIRIVEPDEACHGRETPLVWSIVGPPGPEGPEGPPGPQGEQGPRGEQGP